MRRFIFNLFIFNIVLIGGFLSSCSENDDNETETTITVNDLPSESQSFLNKYYRGIEITKIEKEVDGDIEVFEVYLENGHQVVFNSEGEWQQVEAPFEETIPTGFILSEIMEYLDENFSGYGINEINRTGYGYKVQLVTELNLMFNDLGQYLGPVSDE